ncbi:cytochrome P450 [Mycena polygramma]|nr:cytochrome P450 [Mycena polygramma]
MELPIHYAAALAVLISTLAAYVVSRPKSVVAQIAGPPSPSWIFGHLRQLILSAQYGDYEFGWLKLYGPVYRIRGFWREDRLMVSDPVALRYMVNSPVFTREPVLDGLANMLFGGKSVLTVKGERNTVAFKAAVMIADEFERSTTASTDVCPLLSTGTLAAISEAARVLRTQRYLTDRIGRRVVGEKMDAVDKGLEINNDVYGRLLAPDASNSSKRLSEADVVGQTGGIVVAGQGTTANTVGFALLELARHPEFQDKIRDEIHSVVGGGASNVYEHMPLLNALIKVGAALYPALPISPRIALEDAVIPLSESITTSAGEHINQIPVKRGQIVAMAFASYQRLPTRWGEDPDQFRPSRWLDNTTHQEHTLTPYANLLSFNAGPHICLGWRFAVLEMQGILCELVGKFSFAEAEGEAIRAKHMTSLLPIDSNGERALPLRITRVLYQLA